MMPHFARPFSTTRLLHNIFSFALEAPRRRPCVELPCAIRGPPRRTYARKFILQRPARNEEIKAYNVRLKHEDGTISDAEPTWVALARLTPATHLVVLDADEDSRPPVPICRIVNIEQERASKQKAAVSKQLAVKTLELNWGIDNHDLTYRLKRLGEFIAKGHRVEILCAPKKRGKKEVTMPEARAMIAKLRDTTREAGGKESKDMEGHMLGRCTLFLERAKA